MRMPIDLYQIHDTARDQATTSVTVEINTAKWSTVKRNKVIHALETGVINCGYNTAMLIKDVGRAYGLTFVWERSYSPGYIDSSYVRPDKLDDLLAIAVAQKKIRDNDTRARGGYVTNYAPAYVQWANGVRNYASVSIPFNGVDISEYLKPDDPEHKRQREKVADIVRGRGVIQIKYVAAGTKDDPCTVLEVPQ